MDSAVTVGGEGRMGNKGAGAGSAAQSGRRRGFRFGAHVGVPMALDDSALDVLHVGVRAEPDTVGLQMPDPNAGKMDLRGLDPLYGQRVPGGRGKDKHRKREKRLSATDLDPIGADLFRRGKASHHSGDRPSGQSSLDAESPVEEHRIGPDILAGLERAVPFEGFRHGQRPLNRDGAGQSSVPRRDPGPGTESSPGPEPIGDLDLAIDPVNAGKLQLASDDLTAYGERAGRVSGRHLDVADHLRESPADPGESPNARNPVGPH